MIVRHESALQYQPGRLKRASKKKRILLGSAAAAVIVLVASFFAARVLLKRVEPFVREQTVRYLSAHLGADVEIAALHVELPAVSKLRVLWTHGRGSFARVRADGTVIHRKGKPGEPALLSMKTFSFQVDIGRIFDQKKEVKFVHIDGLEVHVPPRSERSGMPRTGGIGDAGDIVVEQFQADNTLLVLEPADPRKKPLRFAIQRLHLKDVGLHQPMLFDAALRNPRPPGEIVSTGSFGPWNVDDPGSTPLQGDYTFSHADLGVFKAIAGILDSTGKFDGELSHVQVHGETRVPDFRLKESGNRLPLTTRFDAEVDGTSGDTILKPVQAQLGRSSFVTSGAVVRRGDDIRRTINLTVKMNNGHVEDFLRLAMKGSPPLEGDLRLNAQIGIPPLDETVAEKLHLKGSFALSHGKFLRSAIQDRLDELSRKGQGQPKNAEIDDVVSRMSGTFAMEDKSIQFSRLDFGVNGADIKLSGKYGLDSEALDFHGVLRLRAKVSQTQTGWKRWALIPVDPFFAKNGAGTFLHIRIGGTRNHVEFGRDHR